MTKRKDKRTNKDLQNTVLKVEQHEPNKMSELKSGGSEGLAVPALLVTPVVLLLNENNITDM
jgi:hypothetical protein